MSKEIKLPNLSELITAMQAADTLGLDFSTDRDTQEVDDGNGDGGTVEITEYSICVNQLY